MCILKECVNIFFLKAFCGVCSYMCISVLVYVHMKCVWLCWQGACCASLAPAVFMMYIRQLLGPDSKRSEIELLL